MALMASSKVTYINSRSNLGLRALLKSLLVVEMLMQKRIRYAGPERSIFVLGIR